MPTESFLPLGGWLLTYLLHSTLLLGAAWLLTARWVRLPAWRDLVWKVALVGGLVTSLLQGALDIEPLGGRMALGTGARQPPPTPVAAGGDWRGLLMAPTTPSSAGKAAGAPAAAGVTEPSAVRPASPPPMSPAMLIGTAEPVLPSTPARGAAWLLVGWAVCGAVSFLTNVLPTLAVVTYSLASTPPSLLALSATSAFAALSVRIEYGDEARGRRGVSTV